MKKLLALLLSLTLVFSLAGCGDKAEEPAEEPADATQEEPKNDQEDDQEDLENIDIVLDWYPNAVHAFLFEAEKNGYFKDAGLKVNLIYPSNPTDPLTMAAAGKADFGLYYQEDIILAKANENVPVKVLGAVVQEPLDVICSLKDKNIKTAADLAGKTIGYTGVEFAETAVQEVLASAGLTMDDTKMVEVGFDLMSAMTTGNVDATFGCFINHEIPALAEEGFDTNVILTTDNGVPNYCALMLVTGEENLKNRKDVYAKFLDACRKGFEDVKADTEGALKLMMESQDAANFPLTESVERKSFETLLPMMEHEDAPFLTQKVEDWQNNIDWLKRTGMIKNTFAPEDIMVDLDAQ